MRKIAMITFLMGFVLFSCDEDTMSVNPEGFSYANSNIEIDFYEEGKTGVPSITWNGSIGSFGLADTYDGVSINSATGVVSWDNDLALGETEVTIIATNANGNANTTITLDHMFSGSFPGSYNFNPGDMNVSGSNYKLTFSADGTVLPLDAGSPGTGTYTIDDNNKILATYAYNNAPNDPIYLDAQLTYSSTISPYVDGVWGNNESNPNSGYFKVDLD